MGAILDVLVAVALAAVVTTLGFGFYSLYRGGDFALKWSNKLMRLRVMLQAVAIIVIVADILWRARR